MAGKRHLVRLSVVLVVIIGLILLVRQLMFPEAATLPVEAGQGPDPTLPPPNKTLMPTVNVAPAVGWPLDAVPTAAQGLRVTAFSTGLEHPRWLYRLPNGDILVAESNAPAKDSGGLKDWVAGKIMERAGAGVTSPDRITLLRDTDGDGSADERSKFLEELHSPFGMALIGDDFYVAHADSVWRYEYPDGALVIDDPGEKVVDLPAGINHHWTKNLLASPDGSRLYVAVGSNSNVGERGMAAEEGRAAIWELDVASGEMRLFATGLRNPVGMDWEPETGALWTVVNERDEIGSDLVPDYATSVQDGGFYGWPYSYFGQHVDARVQPQKPELVERAIVPDYALGAHTASLGLTFADESGLGDGWRQGMFIGQHGSWNRRPKSGYKVIYVPFENGSPAGKPVDVLTGFLSDDEEALGRPVGVIFDAAGSLLVADDVGNTIWRVSAADGDS